MNPKGLIRIAVAAMLVNCANAQTQSPLELGDGISIKTASLEAAFKARRPLIEAVLFNTTSVNISMLAGPGNLAWYSAGELIGQQDGVWILTELTDELPPVPEIPGGLVLTDESLDSAEATGDLPGQPIKFNYNAQTYTIVKGRVFLRRNLAQSGWKPVDPATLTDHDPVVYNDGVPPPTPAPEPD